VTSRAAVPAAPSLPAAGTYHLDPPHTFAYFNARHLVVGLVRGRFDKVAGTLVVAREPSDCTLDVTIDAASVSTQNAMRDDDLRGPDYFDVKDHATLTYQGRGIRRMAGGVWEMEGTLTVRGVARAVPLRFAFLGMAPAVPGKPARAAFHGAAATRRGEYGMTRDLLAELGFKPAPGPDVVLELDAEALLDPSTP
jgi:polyisoprenoid-binding protein YceI